jgi:hypothetical protein
LSAGYDLKSMTMRELYDKFSLDEGTRTFTGHAMGLQVSCCSHSTTHYTLVVLDTPTWSVSSLAIPSFKCHVYKVGG